MARLSEIISCVVKEAEISEGAARVIGRSLREAGLVATGGRGLSGAQMDANDVASVLLACALICDLTKVGEEVRKVLSLQLCGMVRIKQSSCFSGLAIKIPTNEVDVHNNRSLAHSLPMYLKSHETSLGKMRGCKCDYCLKIKKRVRGVCDDPTIEDLTAFGLELSVSKDRHGYEVDLFVTYTDGAVDQIRYIENGVDGLRVRKPADEAGVRRTVVLPNSVFSSAVKCMAGYKDVIN